MKTEQIIYLNDIAQTNSITQTAQRFFISQQALSATIKKLEDEFNTTFLERSNKGVILTKEGTYFLEQMQAVLDIYFRTKDELNTIALPTTQTLLKGEVRILCHTRVLSVLIPDILQRFIERYPDITISLKEQENIDIIEGTARQECDFGILFAPDFILNKKEASIPKNIDFQVLFTDKFIVCCSKQHKFASKDYILQQDMDIVPVVLFDTNPKINTIPEKDQNKQQTQIFSNNVQFHKDMLLKGIMVSCITSFEFRKLYLKYKSLTAIPMQSNVTSNITLVTNTDHPLSPQAQLFIQMLKCYDFYRI